MGAGGQASVRGVGAEILYEEIPVETSLVDIILVVPPIDGPGLGSLHCFQRLKGRLYVGFEGGLVEGFYLILGDFPRLPTRMTVIAINSLIDMSPLKFAHAIRRIPDVLFPRPISEVSILGRIPEIQEVAKARGFEPLFTMTEGNGVVDGVGTVLMVFKQIGLPSLTAHPREERAGGVDSFLEILARGGIDAVYLQNGLLRRFVA